MPQCQADAPTVACSHHFSNQSTLYTFTDAKNISLAEMTLDAEGRGFGGYGGSEGADVQGCEGCKSTRVQGYKGARVRGAGRRVAKVLPKCMSLLVKVILEAKMLTFCTS